MHSVLMNTARGQLSEIADAVGLSYDALYARLRNRVVFSPEEVRALITAVPDARIASWVLLNTGYIAAERGALDQPDLNEQESLRHSVIRMLIEASEAAAQVESALRDGYVDHREAIQIQQDIETAERAIATLRTHVSRYRNP
ncbi:phage regulatory CII family protein [Ruegeria sp. HKCCD7318]|uniref:phage regulatory CII family protein n=1 Tax=Ruegeria sp. HKCCD7318 TaxID=2683014 RepID=UPI003530173F